MADKEKLQQTYMQYQMLGQQIKQTQQQIQVLEQQIMELAVTVQGIDDLEKTKVGAEILVPVSSGIFAKAELKDNKELLLNVGSGTVVTKDFAGTKGLITKQLGEMQKMQQNLTGELQKLAVQAQMLEKEIESMSK